MVKESSGILLLLFDLVFALDLGMRNEGQKAQGSGRNNGFLRSFSSYLRIVSNGASTMASTVKSAGASVASSIADRDSDARDQVFWAGFDKLEGEGGVLRQVLLLGYRSGFQVWDVEFADDVRQLASRHDGPVSFLQMLKHPMVSKRTGDKFVGVRPLLVVVGDVSLSGSNSNSDGTYPGYGNSGIYQEFGSENSSPTFVHFYSLRTHDYVHVLKFRTAVLSVRCSPRIIAISQTSQIHCFNAGTLEREYTILTCPIASGSPLSGGIGYGPLAVGPRWLAYSGNPVVVSNTSRVSPQNLTSATSLSQSPNGSLVAHYAKESSKQLAAGIVTLGDIGYKKFTKYCSELIADSNGSLKNGSSSCKANGTINSHLPDLDIVGMVVVRDVVLKSVIVQFRAHRSPIAALCFDPSGTLLVTASINGHNINVFRIIPPRACGTSSDTDATGSCIHLYRLQRGITNAVIQDISFSDDSQCIMISSSRGTSHLFSVSPSEWAASPQVSDVNLTICGYEPDSTFKSRPQSSVTSKLHSQGFYPSGNPITLSVVSRIRNGNGWKGAVTGAAAAATGRVSPLSGAIASVFHNCKGSGLYPNLSSSTAKYNLLVFSPTGCIIQYVLRQSTGEDSGIDLHGLSTVSNGMSLEPDSRLVVVALQKWDICHKQNRRDRVDHVDVYGEHANDGTSKLLQKGVKRGTSIYPTDSGRDLRVKHSAEENHHMYISEAELHMHSARPPLWAKPEIYFEAIVDENIIIDDNNVTGGEIEIERFTARTIETGPKELIPLFDRLQSSRFQQSRTNHFDHSRNGPQTHQQSGISGDGRLSRRSSSVSLDRMSENSATAEHPSNTDVNCWGTFHASTEDFVNNSKDIQNVKNELGFVNNREGLEMEGHLECVNSNESLKMESHFLDHDNDVD